MPSSFSFSRMWTVAGHVWVTAFRQRLLAGFSSLFLMLLIAALGLQSWHFGSSDVKFIIDLGFGGVAVFGAVLTIIATTSFFFEEVEQRTVQTLFAKPILGAEYILGKWLGSILVIGLFCAAASAVLAGLVTLRGGSVAFGNTDSGLSHAPGLWKQICIVGLIHWLKFVVLTACVLLISAHARTSLFTVVLSFLILAICHLQFLLREVSTTANAAWVRSIYGAVQWFFPNFQIFSLGDWVVSGKAIPWSVTASLSGYAGLYAAVFVGFAVLRFRPCDV